MSKKIEEMNLNELKVLAFDTQRNVEAGANYLRFLNQKILEKEQLIQKEIKE